MRTRRHTRPLTRLYYRRNIAAVDDGHIPRNRASTVIHDSARSGRRPPNPQEQARREEWGRKWGAANSHSAQQIKEEEAK